MSNKIHCGNCGQANKPSCYSTCSIKKSNDIDRASRKNACKTDTFFAGLAENFRDWCRTSYYQKGRG